MNRVPSSGPSPIHPTTEGLEASRQRLLRAVQTSRIQLPGLVAAALARGFEGTRIVNYAQWLRLQDFASMSKHPGSRR